MSITIALAGNPNSGKTTLFNALTGSNQFVGNWPGVTVEKKTGQYKKNKNISITDLPGIYSLSPYTLEEVVARNYLVNEKPDVILNIVDGTNLERNLYLTTQLMELGIPMVLAVNMIDLVEKSGDKFNTSLLSKLLKCPVVEISALKGKGITDAADTAIKAAKKKDALSFNRFGIAVENALSRIEKALRTKVPKKDQRFYAIKLFERDEKIQTQLMLEPVIVSQIESLIQDCENTLDDDAESIITSERYETISGMIDQVVVKAATHTTLSTTDQIDRVVTNRFLALPIFALIMLIVYYISVTTVGGVATDWANDGVFGDGWHFLGIGSAAYAEADEQYTEPAAIIAAFESAATEASLDPETAEDLTTTAFLYDDSGNVETSIPVDFTSYLDARAIAEPDPSQYGLWITGVPVALENGLNAINCVDWLQDLILNGIVAGVGAVLGFVPQMLILFFFLAFLESCGYMARVAFIMDRIFRKFGLSGKSFIPMLIGTGCSVPGIMASRTIKNERDRRMTIITTSFIPCGAKLPIIALIAGAMFAGAWWVAPSAYFIGMAAVVMSGILLKKTRIFQGDVSPFVMELPSYHLPTLSNLLRSMWERGWSFIRKAGTIILVATIFVWFTSSYGFDHGSFGMVEMNNSLLAALGNLLAPLFAPLGWGNWQGAVASITGLIAKENVVGTFGVLFGNFDEVAENGWQIWVNMRTVFTPLSAFSFLLFNLLCAPCFAAMGAIKREMNSGKWTAFAIGYQCLFAYVIALIFYQFGSLVTGNGNLVGTVFAIVLTASLLYMLFRPIKKNKMPILTSVKNNC